MYPSGNLLSECGVVITHSPTDTAEMS